MDDRDLLYQSLLQAEEQRKRRNFDVFMDTLEKSLVMDLDKTYSSGDNDSYLKLVHNIKEQGFKVYRNGEGKHKIGF